MTLYIGLIVFDYVLVCNISTYAQSRLTAYDLKDCSFPRSSLHEIFRAVSYKYLTQDVSEECIHILSVIHCFVFNSCTHSHIC